MKINKNKNIGEVIFVVEGGKNEFSLLKHIFTKIFNYTYVHKKRDELDFYEKKNNNAVHLSKIAVVNTESSYIGTIDDNNDFLHRELKKLAFEYGFDIDNSAIFYIFDRDPRSNKKAEIIKRYISTLKNPYDNGFERSGLLLLSYPSSESYIVSSFMDDTYKKEFMLGKEIKTFIGKSSGKLEIPKMNSETILKAVDEMMKYLKTEYIPFDIDNFSNTSMLIFEKQDDHYKQNRTYRLLSLLSVAFIYLGIIEIE